MKNKCALPIISLLLPRSNGPLPEYQKLAIRSMAIELRRINSEFSLTQHGTGPETGLHSSILHLSQYNSVCQCHWSGMGAQKEIFACCCLLQAAEPWHEQRGTPLLLPFPGTKLPPLSTWLWQTQDRLVPAFWLGLLKIATKTQVQKRT